MKGNDATFASCARAASSTTTPRVHIFTRPPSGVVITS
jgi:hypothetical protein